MNAKDTEKKNVDKDYGKFLMEFALHEDKIFTNRVNLFLVTESLLFVAYISLLNKFDSKIIMIIMSVTSIIITLVYIIVLFKNVEILDILKDETQKFHPNYKELKKLYPRHHTNYILGKIFPMIFLIVWGVLAEYSILA